MLERDVPAASSFSGASSPKSGMRIVLLPVPGVMGHYSAAAWLAPKEEAEVYSSWLQLLLWSELQLGIAKMWLSAPSAHLQRTLS